MEKIIIETKPGFELNIRGLHAVPNLVQRCLDSFTAFRIDNGMPLTELEGPAPKVIATIQAAVPNKERLRGMDWIASRISDTKLLQEQTKNRLYELHQGKISGLNVTIDKFKQNVEVPMESTRNLINAVADLDVELLSLTKDQFFWQFLSVVNGKVTISPGAEEKIRERFTVYATKNQEEFYNEVTNILRQLSTLEQKFNVQSLVSKSLIIEDSGKYVINVQLLKSIV